MTGSLAAVATPAAGESQEFLKPLRIGWLSSATRQRGPEDWRPGFERQLRQSGWAPNFDLRYAEGNFDRLTEMAGALVRSSVHVIVATDTAAAAAAKRATATVPIVFVGLADPVGAGLIDSLARPGANVTGCSSAFEDGIVGKWLELLREIRPVMKVGVIANPTNATAGPRIVHLELAALTLGITVLRLPISRPEDLDALALSLGETGIEALIVDADVTIIKYNTRIRALAGTHRLPIVSAWRPDAERQGGSTLTYGPSLPELFRQAAVCVDKIARGAKPAALPVEQIRKYDLVINVNTAKALGLAIPRSLLLRADQVIE